MKKKSSIEWFQEQIIKIVNGTCELSEIQIFEQAKRMHEIEIIKAHFTAQPFSATMMHNAEQYYNLTFNQDGAEQN
jgi:hypothetical protein